MRASSEAVENTGSGMIGNVKSEEDIADSSGNSESSETTDEEEKIANQRMYEWID